MEDLLKSFTVKYDFKAEALPVGRLAGLENDFKKCLQKGLIDNDVYDLYLNGFSFTVPDELKEAKSIIIISMARPQHRLSIDPGGRAIDIIIPPTYIDYRKTYGDIFKLLKEWLAAGGYGLSRALLPYKLTAARSGMAKYGKNNIAYIGQWGSFHQLAGFYTDWKTSRDPWQEMKILDACRSCTLCIEACPTGAILTDRFSIDTPGCLTFLNEQTDEIPAWISSKSHNSLIGCMRCQLICPYNKKVKDWIVDIGKLDRDETARLMEGNIDKKKDLGLINRFKSLGLYEYLDIIPRNLKLLTG